MDVYIFSEELELIGHTDVMSSGIWTNKFTDVGTFEFWAPLDEKHTELLKETRLVYMMEHKSAGVIELIEKESSDADSTLHVGGRLLKCYLDRRVVYPSFNKTAQASEVARELVKVNCISPSDSKRVIPNLELKAGDPKYGESVSLQKTGGSLLNAEIDFLKANSLGSIVDFDPEKKKLTYSVLQGKNRTIDQNTNDPVLLSTDMDSILKSSYEYDESEEKNFAYVAGEGEGSSRKVTSVGETSSGLARKELYVDARDIQSTKTDESGNTTTIPTSEYEAMLKTRGKEKLKEYAVAKNFETTIRTDDLAGFVFDKDYFLGDTITVYDSVLKVKADVTITAAEYSYKNSGDEVSLTLGYPRLSVMEKLKREVK